MDAMNISLDDDGDSELSDVPSLLEDMDLDIGDDEDIAMSNIDHPYTPSIPTSSASIRKRKRLSSSSHEDFDDYDDSKVGRNKAPKKALHETMAGDPSQFEKLPTEVLLFLSFLPRILI